MHAHKDEKLFVPVLPESKQRPRFFHAVAHGIGMLKNLFGSLFHAAVRCRVSRKRAEQRDPRFRFKLLKARKRAVQLCKRAFVFKKGGEETINPKRRIVQT